MYLIYILLLIFAFSFVKLTKVKKKNTYLNQSYNKKLLIVRNLYYYKYSKYWFNIFFMYNLVRKKFKFDWIIYKLTI